MISFGKFNYLSLCCRSIFVSDSKDNPCDLDSSGHPSQGEHVWFNEAQIGDTVQCSGPFPFDSLCSGSGMTPMRRLLSPGGSEWCSSTVQEQEERGDPSLFAQWVGLHAHPFVPTPPPQLPCPLSRKFWHKQLWSAREWQVYSRFQQACKGGACWWSGGITTRVEAVLQTYCLSFFAPGGFFLTVYTSLGFVCCELQRNQKEEKTKRKKML